MQKALPIFLKLIGIALVFVGLLGAYYGPLEIWVFYLFSQGGQFYYEGFQVGSLWFAYLVIQNSGYYLVAVLALPLGIGHLKLHRWALTLARLYAWVWMGFGILLLGNLVALLPTVTQLGVEQADWYTRIWIVGGVSVAGLVIAPLLVLWFYNRPEVKAAFEAREVPSSWIEKTPFTLLPVLLLLSLQILVLHYVIFLQGIFPLFGRVIVGRPNVYWISLVILVTGILMYGLARLKPWAWWGTCGLTAALALSTGMTLPRYSFYELVSKLNLPAYEWEFVDQMVVLHDFHLTSLVVVPLLAALGLLLHSKRYFSAHSKDG
jgi:hypothetical protein